MRRARSRELNLVVSGLFVFLGEGLVGQQHEGERNGEGWHDDASTHPDHTEGRHPTSPRHRGVDALLEVL